MRQTVALLACVGVVSGCLDVADGRAGRDNRIGRVEVPGISIEVRNGLATALSLTPAKVELWLQAPAIEFDLVVPPGAPPLEVVARNALFDVGMTGTTTSSPGAVVVGPASGSANVRQWTVTPPAQGGLMTLTIAPADAAMPGAFRFAVFGDVQEAIDRVQDIYGRMRADPTIRFAVIVGDLTSRGTEAQLEEFRTQEETLPFPVYATLGNHELGEREDMFHDHFGRGNLSFVYREVQFTLLDTASATVSPMVYDWLGGWLVEGLGRAHFTFCHIPPLDPTGTRNGAFASRTEANKLLSLLASGRVDATFYGHLHTFESFSNAGMPAYITGGGGAIPERFDGIGRHYLTVDVDAVQQLTQVGIVRVD